MSANSIAKIDKQLQELNPDSLRHKILVSLRKFRSSWVELGKLLTDVAYGGDYKEWGYEDFEIYCARELGLKKPTVKKLMVSYNYMKSYEPTRLAPGEEDVEQDTGYDVPDYQTVELLKKARDRDDLPEEQKEELHRMAFDSGSDETVLRKEIRDRLKPTSEEDIDGANFARRREIESILRTARALRQKLAATNAVPEGVKDRIENALMELEALD